MNNWWDGGGQNDSKNNDDKTHTDTMNRQNMLNINDYRPHAVNKQDEVIVSTDSDIVNKDGSQVRQVTESHVVAADGRRYSVLDFGGFSWTNEWSPAIRLYPCLNPFDHHAPRNVFLEVDGGVTESGNVLCNECLKHNKGRADLRDSLLTLGGLLYSKKFEIF